MSVSRSWFALIITTFALMLLPPLARDRNRAATPPGPYVVTDLGTLGGLSAQATDITNAGQVVGYATTPASGARAFLWQNGVMTDLGTLGGNYSRAEAINGLGQVAGNSTPGANVPAHAVLWDGGGIIDLTPGNDGSAASGINDARQIVGTMNNGLPFLWQNGVLTNLGHLGGGGGFAADINNAAQAVGSSYTTIVTKLGPAQHAFLWQNGVMTDLGVLPGGDDESGASAINEIGQIVGSSMHTDPETYEVTSHAFLYDGGVMTAIPVPSSESYASDINDAGVVVGTMTGPGGFGRYHAYIYADGVVTSLNSLIPSGSALDISVALGINNAGQIVGWGYDARATYHAFLLTPVAPGTPVVSIADASVTEGHTGTRPATFTATLSPASNQPVTVSFSTANGSAAAGSDYQSASGTVTFDAGQTTQTISVLVNGDRAGEANETFLVNLTQAGGAAIGDGQAAGTIVDDEPRVRIDDVSKNEGNNGTTRFVFTVSVSPAPEVAVSVNFATANGSANSVDDYVAQSGTLTFNAGETSKTVIVAVKGDRKVEFEEVFYLNLTGAAGAFIADGQGVGVVRNDDR